MSDYGIDLKEANMSMWRKKLAPYVEEVMNKINGIERRRALYDGIISKRKRNIKPGMFN